MKYVPLTFDNCFIGCEIIDKKQQKLYIYKINEKSFYAGAKTFKEVDSCKRKGETYSDYMKRVEGSQFKYDGFQILETEVAKREEIVKIQEIKKGQKELFKKEIKEKIIERFKLLKKGLGCYQTPFEVGNDWVVIIKYEKDLKMCLTHFNTVFVFWDMETGVYTEYDEKTHKKGKDIVWPEKVKI